MEAGPFTGAQTDEVVDSNPEIFELASAELIDGTTQSTGCRGMSVDSIVRAVLLK